MKSPGPNPELLRAVEYLTSLPEPPKCADCGGLIEAAWWNYCAMCGKHLAAGNEPR